MLSDASRPGPSTRDAAGPGSSCSPAAAARPARTVRWASWSPTSTLKSATSSSGACSSRSMTSPASTSRQASPMWAGSARPGSRTARATCWDSSSRRSRRHPDQDPTLSASPLIGPAGSCCRIAVLHTHLPLPSAAGPRIPEPSSPLPGAQIKHLCARNGARPESRPVAPNGGCGSSGGGRGDHGA